MLSFRLGWSNFNDLVAYTTNGNGISTGLRTVESSNSPFEVTRAYVPAFGLHSGPRDHSGKIFRFHGPSAHGKIFMRIQIYHCLSLYLMLNAVIR